METCNVDQRGVLVVAWSLKYKVCLMPSSFSSSFQHSSSGICSSQRSPGGCTKFLSTSSDVLFGSLLSIDFYLAREHDAFSTEGLFLGDKSGVAGWMATRLVRPAKSLYLQASKEWLIIFNSTLNFVS